jgi:putative tryptophan/tyrosine transport system substrate-binding protein
MQRRDFIKIVAGSAIIWPLAARAQQPTLPVIGLLQIGTPSGYDLSGFRQGLKDVGYVEGENLAIEYRFANDDPARLSALASDLVGRQVRVIAVLVSGLAARAVKDATNTIPIVSVMGPTRSNKVLSPTSIGRAATPPGSSRSATSFTVNNSESCTNCCRKRPILPYSPIPKG